MGTQQNWSLWDSGPRYFSLDYELYEDTAAPGYSGVTIKVPPVQSSNHPHERYNEPTVACLCLQNDESEILHYTTYQ